MFKKERKYKWHDPRSGKLAQELIYLKTKMNRQDSCKVFEELITLKHLKNYKDLLKTLIT
jgi:hypothetical protein